MSKKNKKATIGQQIGWTILSWQIAIVIAFVMFLFGEGIEKYISTTALYIMIGSYIVFGAIQYIKKISLAFEQIRTLMISFGLCVMCLPLANRMNFAENTSQNNPIDLFAANVIPTVIFYSPYFFIVIYGILLLVAHEEQYQKVQ